MRGRFRWGRATALRLSASIPEPQATSGVRSPASPWARSSPPESPDAGDQSRRLMMDASDLKGLYAESTKRMSVALEHVKHELAGVRTGRASVTILDGIHVEAYGSKMPLNQVAGLSVPEPPLIVPQPFDPSQLKAIESAV